jgi:hypothetical protein
MNNFGPTISTIFKIWRPKSAEQREQNPRQNSLEPAPYIVLTGEHCHNMMYFTANFLDFPEAIAYK